MKPRLFGRRGALACAFAALLSFPFEAALARPASRFAPLEGEGGR